MNRLNVAPLFEGPIDVVGDVHGEIQALHELLGQLGYESQGVHARGRRLVFVGDLGDRGPDSPAVIELVASLVERGLAQCVLGNHELNLLRDESKPGNRWFTDPSHTEQQPGGEFANCKLVSEWHKPQYLAFMASLPLALERADLRIVHAAWMPGEIDALRHEGGSVVQLFLKFEERTLQLLEVEGLLEAARNEEELWGRKLSQRSADVPMLPALGKVDERLQMGNPVKVLTSGAEQLAQDSFWSGGKWRMCHRVRWWAEYADPVPVIVGHYWRHALPVTASDHASTKPAMFDNVVPTAWVGVQKNVFCVDFSVGARYQERKAGVRQFTTHLAAMRWPERQLWFETGRVG